ncbi:MAG TPA: hypothetical protein PLA80_01380 [Synergistaceae bacterium]|nr:hypothetical protein [Synergistaceae bacterium]
MKRSVVLWGIIVMICCAVSGAFGAELEVVTPTDGQDEIPNTSYNLIWRVTSGDEDISSLYTYDVYFGTTNEDLLTPAEEDLEVEAYTVSNLAYEQTYLWKIRAAAVSAATEPQEIIGGIWRFTTWDGGTLTFEVVAPPDISDITDPEEIGNSGVVIDQNLQWRCTVGDLLINGLSYSVRLGTSGSNMPAVATGITDMIYDPDLAHDQMYYWQIIAAAPDGRSWTGPIWKFYTLPKGTMGGSGCSLGSLSWGGSLLLLPLGYALLKSLRK